MGTYTVEVGTRASETLERIHEAAGESLDKGDLSHPNIALLNSLYDLIDKIISRNPFNRRRLVGRLSSIYWVSRGRLRVFFTPSPKPNTVVIVRISTRPRFIPSDRQADAIIQQMISLGKVRVAIQPGRFVH